VKYLGSKVFVHLPANTLEYR